LGKTVVVIEHNLRIVQKLGDWVYLMEEGRIEAFGPPSEVLRDKTLVSMFATV
jgi:ABC-type branched-subunit amino acid transport system ATPase component